MSAGRPCPSEHDLDAVDRRELPEGRGDRPEERGFSGGFATGSSVVFVRRLRPSSSSVVPALALVLDLRRVVLRAVLVHLYGRPLGAYDPRMRAFVRSTLLLALVAGPSACSTEPPTPGHPVAHDGPEAALRHHVAAEHPRAAHAHRQRRLRLRVRQRVGERGGAARARQGRPRHRAARGAPSTSSTTPATGTATTPSRASRTCTCTARAPPTTACSASCRATASTPRAPRADGYESHVPEGERGGVARALRRHARPRQHRRRAHRDDARGPPPLHVPGGATTAHVIFDLDHHLDGGIHHGRRRPPSTPPRTRVHGQPPQHRRHVGRLRRLRRVLRDRARSPPWTDSQVWQARRRARGGHHARTRHRRRLRARLRPRRRRPRRAGGDPGRPLDGLRPRRPPRTSPPRCRPSPSTPPRRRPRRAWSALIGRREVHGRHRRTSRR